MNFEQFIAVTTSFRRDFAQCVSLCNSIDQYAPGMRHQLIVPRRDYRIFRGLKSRHRDVITVEDILPVSVTRLPTDKEKWVIGFRRLASGQTLQKIEKIQAAATTDATTVLFVDTDLSFIRPLNVSMFVQNGRTTLCRYDLPNASPADPSFTSLARGANRLLGLPAEAEPIGDFIDPLAAWDTRTVQNMIERIESTARRDWISAAIEQTRRYGFSECLTYRLFAENYAADRHVHSNISRCLRSCSHDLSSESGRDGFVASVADHHVAVLIRPHLNISPSILNSTLIRIQNSTG